MEASNNNLINTESEEAKRSSNEVEEDINETKDVVHSMNNS